MKTIEQLKEIVPGKTYPNYVKVTELNKQIEFHLQSYVCGMYCAIHIDGSSIPAVQTGDRNNKKFVTGLKKDLKKALDRGATITIGSICACNSIAKVS